MEGALDFEDHHFQITEISLAAHPGVLRFGKVEEKGGVAYGVVAC